MNRLGKLAALFLALAFVLAPGLAAASPLAAGHPEAGAKGLAWTLGQQQADGSFPGFGVGSTADAVYALAAAKGSAINGDASAAKAIAYLETNAKDYAKSAGAAAKLALALTATNMGDRAGSFGGVDLVGVINGAYDAASGHYGSDVTGHAYSILALKTLGHEIPAATRDWLLKAQAPGGGWAFDGADDDTAADTNTTGLALEALAAAGGDWGAAKAKALAYLHSQQNADGGYAYQKGPGNDSDANSTASVVQGLIAAGENPEAWAVNGANPVSLLLSLQNASGAFRYQAAQADDNGGATYQAIPAVLGIALPVVVSAAPVGATPGMPTTGAADTFAPIAALLAGLALTLLGLGARRAARAL